MSYSDLYMQLMGGGGGYNQLASQIMSNQRSWNNSVYDFWTSNAKAASDWRMREQLPYAAEIEKAKIQAAATAFGSMNDLEKQRRGFLADDYGTRMKYYKQYGLGD